MKLALTRTPNTIRPTRRCPDPNRLAVWLSGNALASINVVRSCATSDQVSTRMGDRLCKGKPSRFVYVIAKYYDFVNNSHST